MKTQSICLALAIGLVGPLASAQFVQQGNKLVGTGAVRSAGQGLSVALSGDGNTAIVGGPSDNYSVGAAWVFTSTNGTWSQQGLKLVGTGAVGNAYQGHSVALSADGNTAILGGSTDNYNVGAAWVFTSTNGTWSQQGLKLVGTSDLWYTRGEGSPIRPASGGTGSGVPPLVRKEQFPRSFGEWESEAQISADTTMHLIKHYGYYHVRYKVGASYRIVSTGSRNKQAAIRYLRSFNLSACGKITIAGLA
jgi:hypothetical protein